MGLSETTLVLIIGYHSPVIETLRRVSSLIKIPLNVVVLSPETSQSRVSAVRSARAIILYTHTLPKEVEDAIIKGSAEIVISVSEAYAHLNKCDVESLKSVILYFKYGGTENYINMLKYLAWKLGVIKEEPNPPKETPWAAIWHPKLGVFTDVKEYLSRYYKCNKPLIGILFHRTWFLNSTLEPVKCLIEEVEKVDLGVIPVFTTNYRNEITDEPTAEDTIRRFFLSQGEPIIDLLIDMLSFFLLNHGKSREWVRKFNVVSGIELLRRLGVVVIKPLRDYYQDVSEWLGSNGIKYLTQVYEVIMPEVDGVTEPIFLSGSKDLGNYRVPQPFQEHARYIARRVRRWVELRRKSPRNRRVAIVLNNPPCKQLEATIGVGLGLDVPESIVKLLHRLKDSGYWLGNEELPKNGKELIKLILERRATSEFRWTSPKDIVRRGGYVGMVDLGTYMEWFNELPREVRDEMIREWGDPKDVLSGDVEEIFAGAVYEGKFIVPGIRFGNVVIIPQPKFGCAGSLCDGRVCKILHKPDIPPPHQWLAVYRWLTRVFKADVIIHFGTHGYLEFRPGKGVGLSPSCWPEITLDDVPLLYVYVVSNPMEGVIAKRRGYAVLVDHVYPAMMDASGGLRELDRLVEEYSRAINLGEVGRAEVIFSRVAELVKKLGLPIKVPTKKQREFIEEVHRFLDLVRSSQVERGLHVFGSVSKDYSRLAEHVVTVMKYDTGSWPSIIRAVAKYLGLNYELIRSNPEGFCSKLGMSNRKALEVIHKVAKRTLESLLSKGIKPSELRWDVLSEALRKALEEVINA